MKIISGVLGAVIVMAFFTACSKDEPIKTNDPNELDKEFMVVSAYNNRNAIGLSELAIVKSANDSVKKLAQTLISAQTTAFNELDLIATNYGYQLPAEMDTAHKALRSQLNGLSGYRFDSAYVKNQIIDLEKAVNLAEYETRLGNAPDIKSYAEANRPKLQLQFQLANGITDDL